MSNKKKFLWAIASLLIALLTVWAVIAQEGDFSLKEYGEFISSSNVHWLAAAFLCSMGFIWCEGAALNTIASGLGYRKGKRHNTVYSAADVYFSAITPSATGGQPASAYFMIKDGIPGTVTTVILITNLIMYTSALVIIGVVCLIFGHSVITHFSTLSIVLILVSTVCLIGLDIAFYMLLHREMAMHKLCEKGLNLLVKLRIVKKPEKHREKLAQKMDEFRVCAADIRGKKKMELKALGWNVLQRVSQLAVAFCVVMARGIGFGKALEIFTIQCFVAVGSNCVPIPGSMGVADYLMLDGYTAVVGEDIATNLELLSRGVSFYCCIFISAVITLIAFIARRFRRKNDRIS